MKQRLLSTVSGLVISSLFLGMPAHARMVYDPGDGDGGGGGVIVTPAPAPTPSPTPVVTITPAPANYGKPDWDATTRQNEWNSLTPQQQAAWLAANPITPVATAPTPTPTPTPTPISTAPISTPTIGGAAGSNASYFKQADDYNAATDKGDITP